MNLAQALDERCSTGDEASEFIGAIFFLAGDEIGHAQKQNEVMLQHYGDRGIQQTDDGNSAELVDGADILKSANHGALRFVDKGAEFGVAAVVVREFVCKHAAKFGNSEDGEQGQADRHDAAAPESENAAAVGDKGVDLANEINLAGKRLIERGGDVVKLGEETRMRRALQQRARRLERVAPGYERPQHGAGDDNASEE